MFILAAFCDDWQNRYIDAKVVISDYHDNHVDSVSYMFKKIFTEEETYCVKSRLPLVDISNICYCVYYLDGQEKDAVKRLSGTLGYEAMHMRNQASFFDSIKEKLKNKYD